MTRPTVFLVDDHELFRKGVLAELGDAVDVVGEASEVGAAIEMILERRPDVVLLDVHLGGERSHGLLTRMREQGIPVALVTGSVDIDDYRDSADAVLGKPFIPEKLVETARRLARVPR